MKPPIDRCIVWPDGETVFSLHVDEATCRALAAGTVPDVVRENAAGMLELAARHTFTVEEPKTRKKKTA